MSGSVNNNAICMFEEINTEIQEISVSQDSKILRVNLTCVMCFCLLPYCPGTVLRPKMNTTYTVSLQTLKLLNIRNVS